jgi:hypothetical protein
MDLAWRHRVLWGSIVIFAAVMIGAPTLAKRAQSDAIRRQLLGSWRLISWEERDASGRVNHPLGPQAVGQISYTPDGRMSAQLMRPGSNRFASEDWRKATAPEKANAWLDYFGYFGTFSIDLEKKAVVHHIEGSWFPNLIGTDQIRYFRFQDDRLILDADTEWGKVHIVWQKVAIR